MSATCAAVREQIALLLDNELDAAATIALNRHVESCAECRGHLAAHRRLATNLTALGAVADKIAVEHRPIVRFTWLRPLRIAAAIMLVAACGLALRGLWPERPRLTRTAPLPTIPGSVIPPSSSSAGLTIMPAEDRDDIVVHYETRNPKV